MRLSFASPDANAIPLHVVSEDGFAAWVSGQPKPVQTWLAALGFTGAIGKVAVIPDDGGTPTAAVAGIGTAKARDRARFVLAAAQAALPDGVYEIAGDLGGLNAEEEALGWLLSRYRFGRYKAAKPQGAALKPPKGVDVARVEAMAAGEALTRDLINTPASDMGPDALEQAAHALAKEFGARFQLWAGDALLEANFPMIHAVGRAAATAPRLLDMRWGKTGPKLTLVGKGVCFDTGGLNIKPGASMGLMKKDMGGAAHVLGLASMVMSANLPVRLRVLIPAVENSVSGNALRPLDVITTRSGRTIEIGNTDAEGRVVLADGLAAASEETPDLIIDCATLTGAARIALGTEIPALFCNHDGVAEALLRHGEKQDDFLWRMPLWKGYRSQVDGKVADLTNAPEGGYGGAITAALFLEAFVGEGIPWIHVDLMAWNVSSRPGRPEGGEAMGMRAIFAFLQGHFGILT